MNKKKALLLVVANTVIPWQTFTITALIWTVMIFFSVVSNALESIKAVAVMFVKMLAGCVLLMKRGALSLSAAKVNF